MDFFQHTIGSHNKLDTILKSQDFSSPQAGKKIVFYSVCIQFPFDFSNVLTDFLSFFELKSQLSLMFLLKSHLSPVFGP